MARLPISSIFRQIAATVNQEATSPTAGSTEYNLWIEYLNRGYAEWVESHDWEVLRKRFFPDPAGISGATILMPLDFKKLAAPIKFNTNGSAYPTEYPEVLPEQDGLYRLTDKYVEVLGDEANGFAIVFHPGTLASGASVLIQYFATPTSLASPAEVPLVQDSQYLIDRTIAYIFEARSDPRFQLKENQARERLLTMIENADAARYNSYAGQSQVLTPERKQGFRFGRD